MGRKEWREGRKRESSQWKKEQWFSNSRGSKNHPETFMQIPRPLPRKPDSVGTYNLKRTLPSLSTDGRQIIPKFHILTQQHFWSHGFRKSKICEQLSWVARGLSQGCNQVVSQISEDLSGPEALIPRWVSSSSGSQLPLEQVIQQSKAETTISFMTQAQKSHLSFLQNPIGYTDESYLLWEESSQKWRETKSGWRGNLEADNHMSLPSWSYSDASSPQGNTGWERVKVNRGKKTKQKVDLSAK